MGKYMGFLALFIQPIYVKENLLFKPAVLRLKIDLRFSPVCGGRIELIHIYTYIANIFKNFILFFHWAVNKE